MLRQDAWSVEVQSRLQLCNDMPASDAVYHKSCHIRFTTKRKHPDEPLDPRGRRIEVFKENAFLKMCYRLETSNKPLSMDELRQEIGKAIGDESDAYSVQHTKSRLVNHYGSYIFFAEVDGRKDVVCL